LEFRELQLAISNTIQVLHGIFVISVFLFHLVKGIFLIGFLSVDALRRTSQSLQLRLAILKNIFLYLFPQVFDKLPTWKQAARPRKVRKISLGGE